MAEQTEFDQAAAHRYFSATCFNRAWDLMDKPTRTAEEDEEMVRLSLASHWHWTQRPDCTDASVSTGYWQTSRIYALLGQADNARRYGQLCLAASQRPGVPPFYLGYAYEALARAGMVAGDKAQMAAYLQEARRVAEVVPDPDARNLLAADLATIA
jgi:hypothetical protein